MLLRKLIKLVIINVLAIRLVLSQKIYSAAPTCTYSANTAPTAKCYPVNASPSATVTALPASTVTATAAPMTASAVPITATVLSSNIPKGTKAASSMPIATIAATNSKPSSVSSIPTTTISASSMPCSTVTASYMSSPATSPKSPSSTTEVKAYFLPGPVPDPKVTILAGDMPSVVEVKPRIADPTITAVKPSSTDSSIFEVSPVCADPGYIEVTGTFCPDAIKTGNVQASRTMPVVDNSPMTPINRLATACANDDPFSFKSPFLSHQQPVCPGISKMDPIPSSILTQKKTDNPIDFDGLLNSFMNCL